MEKLFEVIGEYSTADAFQDYIYTSLQAREMPTITAIRTDLDEIAKTRGDQPETIEFKLHVHEIWTDPEKGIFFVAGNHSETKEWIRIDANENVHFKLTDQ